MRAAMRPLALAQINHVAAVPPGAAAPRARAVYDQLERDFGVLAPPIALHASAPEVMAAAWLLLRESMVAPGRAGRAGKEAVAAAVSATNTCPYCVDVHGAMLRALAGGGALADLAPDRPGARRDGPIAALAAWAAPDPAAAPPAAPFPAAEAPEYVGVAVTFHYLNRMVNVFLEDAPMPPGAPRAGLPVVKRILSRMIRSAGRGAGPAGDGLALLEPAPAPPDLDWAAPTPVIADAFARAYAAIGAAGRRTVPAPVRALVRAELAAWDGRARGVGAAWVEAPLARLDPADRAVGRLTLLTAMASYQVSAAVVEDCRAALPGGDGALIEAAAWAALAAARRAAARLAPAPRPPQGPGSAR